jgi:butyryl-CoA dehydrogenase
MLARVKGAPAGVKGLSLFVVPKKRVAADGAMEFNDVNCTGCYHKMGYRGAPIAQLSMGEENDCRGYLVGEEGRGLACMFQMMNEARIGVGKQATAVASGAYYASLQYAKERPQGRPVQSKDPNQPQVPIIEHADIKRLLLFQRAVIDGSLSLLMQAAKYADLEAHGPEAGRERANLLLELLTPVAKSFPSEMGILSTSAAVQILGGYGYTDEFLAEQYFRDMRIHAIHEGTTGIQAMDLLGRKVRMAGGAALKHFVEEVGADLTAAQADPELAALGGRLGSALEELVRVTGLKLGIMQAGKVELALADATLYLDMFGLVAVAWQWLRQGIVARAALARGVGEQEQRFYRGKLATMKYFFHYELPRAGALAARLSEDDPLTVASPEELFAD